jgi:hypothetical protein
MMRGGFSKFDLARLVDGFEEHAAEVTSSISSNRAWKAVSREDVVSEEVQDFFARRFALDWDCFNPPRQTICEDHELGVSASSCTNVRRHVEHVAHQTVEGVRADVRREASALATVRALGKAALVAS